jgi:hypothetical protein
MKKSIGFRDHLSLFTLGNAGRDVGLKLHQSDLAPVFAVAVAEAASDGASAALATRAKEAQTSRMLVPIFTAANSTSPSHS